MKTPVLNHEQISKEVEQELQKRFNEIKEQVKQEIIDEAIQAIKRDVFTKCLETEEIKNIRQQLINETINELNNYIPEIAKELSIRLLKNLTKRFADLDKWEYKYSKLWQLILE